MKLLTILINNRIDHIVDFEPRKKAPDSYIVENTGGDVNLFMFYRESEYSTRKELIYQTQNGKRKASLTKIEAEGLSDIKTGSPNEVTLKLYLQVGEGQDSAKNSDKQFSDDETDTDNFDKQIWDARNLKVKLPVLSGCIYKVKVNFYVREGNAEIRESSLSINVVPQKYIWDVILDYGSEASQMLIFNRGNDQVNVNNIVPLFSMFETSIGSENVAPSDYLQYDADDRDHFFKSFFFARKKPDCDNPDPCAAIRENVNLKLMTPVGDLDKIRKEYLAIPNIKVASHGGVRLPDVVDSNGIRRDIFTFGDNYYYRALINAFLYQAMLYTKRTSEPAFLNICLLMPNVYTQARVTDNLMHVSEDILTLAERNAERVGHVSGVEVSSLSESDASFLGFLSSLTGLERAAIRSGRYLILDAGKGTLDFSILDYQPDMDAQHMYNSIFRSGIIGAGNAITYSVLLAVLNDVIENRWQEVSEDRRKIEISDFIKTKITSPDADESSVCAMLVNLEQYKRLYNADELNTSEFPVNLGGINSLSELGLDALNNILVSYNDRRYKIKDDSYILDMIDELSSDVANKLKVSYTGPMSSKIDYVFFAGRGFQMNKFRECVLEKLKNINSDTCSDLKVVKIADSHATSATYKNICLFVRGPISSGRYNGRLVGKPQLIRHNENAVMAEFLTDSCTASENTDNTSEKNVMKRIVSFYQKFVSTKMLHSETETMETSNYLGGDDLDELNRELVNGFGFKFTSAADEVVFSGVSYSIPPNIDWNSPVQIFFTGSEFVFRQNGEIGYLSAPTNLDCQHVFESSFPFAQIYGEKNTLVPFPVKSERIASDEHGSDDVNEKDELKGYGREDEDILNKHRK